MIRNQCKPSALITVNRYTDIIEALRFLMGSSRDLKID